MPINRIKNDAGFSLVELMIALVLGLLVLGAVIQLFIGSRVTYTTNEAMARVQENGRFALELLKPDTRSVSTRGMCAGRATVTSHLNDDCDEAVTTLFDTSHAIVGWEYDGTGRGEEFDIPTDLDPSDVPVGNWQSVSSSGSTLDLPSALQGRVVPGTDVLVTRNLNRLDIEITGEQNSARLDVVSGSEEIPPRSIVMISNCASGSDLFQQSNSQSGNGTPHKPVMSCTENAPGNQPPGQSSWGTEHDGSSSVYTISTVAYYIGFNADRGEPGLYRANLSQAYDDDDIEHEELVEGVESLQLVYWATDSGQTATAPYVANDVDDWSLIVSVTASILVRSPENGDVDPVSQQFSLSYSRAISPEDRRLRHPFSSTIAVRNQQIVL